MLICIPGLGECKVQLLMSSTFMDVPHDQATWMDVWGPARLILQQCAIKQRTGGIITNIGTSSLPLPLKMLLSMCMHDFPAALFRSDIQFPFS